MVPAEDGKKGQVADECGRLVMDVLERDLRPSSVITRDGARERDRLRGASGRLDQRRAAPAGGGATRPACRSTIDDFDRIAWNTPLLADLKPGGRFVATDLYRAGGMPLVIKRLKEAGLLHEDALTVTGQTIGEEADAAEETEGQEVVRPLDGPDQAERRPRHPARQPRARRLRGEAHRPRPHASTAARRACSSARRTPSRR